MSRPIDAYELRLKGYEVYEKYCKNPIAKEALLEIEKLIVLAPTIEQPKWISCEERLPEDDNRNHFYNDKFLKFTTVLGYDSEGGIRLVNRIKVDPCGIEYVDRLATDGWRWSYRGEVVTHWMPLPEPPKGDE